MNLRNIVSGARESMSHRRRDWRQSLRLGDTGIGHPTSRVPANSDALPMYEKIGLASGFAACRSLLLPTYISVTSSLQQL